LQNAAFVGPYRISFRATSEAEATSPSFLKTVASVTPAAVLASSLVNFKEMPSSTKFCKRLVNLIRDKSPLS